MVDEAGTLHLIDWDGAYLPGCSAARSAQIGSPLYQHPARDEHYFNTHIDDYPLAVISLSIHALASSPELYEQSADRDRLLFTSEELVAGDSPQVAAVEQRWMEQGEHALLALLSATQTPLPHLPDLARLLRGVLRSEEGGGSAPLLTSPLSISSSPTSPLPNTPTLEWPDGAILVDSAEEGWEVIRLQERYGYGDWRARQLHIEPIFESAEPFSEELALVQRGGRRGFIDRAGRWVLDVNHYSEVTAFREGRARVRSEMGYGFINRAAEEVIPARYPFASSFREGLVVVREGDCYGYMDGTGAWVVEPRYERAASFRAGRAAVEEAGSSFFINKKGEKIV